MKIKDNRIFYLQVNGNKPEPKLTEQIKNIANHLYLRYKVQAEKCSYSLGYSGDGFVNNILTLRIEFE